MILQLTADEISRALVTGRRGRFFAEIGRGDWMGLTNLDGAPVLFRGTLRDVLETFIPFNGVVRHVDPAAQGIRRTADSIERVDLQDRTVGRKRYGMRKKTRAESADAPGA